MSEAQYMPNFEPFPVPYIFIQWKGTDVCLDFHCDCGNWAHFDGDFAYALKCGNCDKVWITPHSVSLVPAPEDYTGVTQYMEIGKYDPTIS